MAKKDVIVGFVLDMSCSMDSIRKQTIDGFNEYIDSLKMDESSDIRFCFTLFNSSKIDVKSAIPVSKVKALSYSTYMPDALTPLYDAVGDMIMSIHELDELVDKVLLVIMTDGLENFSKRYTFKTISALIKECQDEYDWGVVYLGANQDAWAVGTSIGIPGANTYTYQSTPVGVTNTFKDVINSTQGYITSTEEPKGFFEPTTSSNK